MSDRVPPFSLEQIGTGTVRFPSGAPIPNISDASVDPYVQTRMPKGVQVEGLQFWPQAKGFYPGLVLLHEWWGLNSQIKDFANRLACEGFCVLVPNLYVRQGGIVTGNAEVAEALMGRTKESELLQDVNSCCEFLNTRDHIKRNIHGVVGFGMGGSLAIRFACHRKRLRTAVSFYGKMVSPPTVLKDLYCPIQYHRGSADEWVTAEEVAQLRQAAEEYGKRVEFHTYDGAPHAFCNETRQGAYRPEAREQAWEAMVTYLHDCFKADMQPAGT
ncbi:dienelactone hydrolase family protein [Nitrospiraceae bacterium AH_259_D15_M11_P09]|nr:dienelactone hydrolase family protein [Nitrospiraceae bacterium AH_259_D15_M11_P09]